MKKIFIPIIIIVFILVIVCIYKLVSYIDYKSKLDNLDKYTLNSSETIYKKFSYKNSNYVITNYNTNTSSYYSHNILLKDNNKYYILDTLNKCDISDYLDNNEYYIHCIGKKGSIIKYTFNGTSIKKDIINLNYKNTPNTNQIYLTIDNVDNNSIYLNSNMKNDDNIKEGNSIKCNIDTRDCEYKVE